MFGKSSSGIVVQDGMGSLFLVDSMDNEYRQDKVLYIFIHYTFFINNFFPKSAQKIGLTFQNRAEKIV